jgi:hypothetical protein
LERRDRAAADGQALVVRIAHWPDDAASPVCLMIDDFTDGWIDVEDSGRPLGRNDWGAGLDAPGSSLRFLMDGLLARFPEIRTTFFIPVDRVEDVRPAAFPFAFRPIDRRPEFVRLLRELAADPRFECAYHGTCHGAPGPTGGDYVAEFELDAELAQALARLRAGEQIWKAVFGAAPSGGKYPAYERGVHGDAAIDVAGFVWWCRRWDAALAAADDAANFAPRFFGERAVVDLPSSVHGGHLTLPPLRRLRPRGVPWYVWARLRGGTRLDEHLDGLLASRAPITVQQHITSSRPDGLVQTPNLYDDDRTLDRIFGRLRGRRVWHATCGEIAGYFRTREHTQVSVVGDRAFAVRRAPGDGPWAPLSLIVNGRNLADAFRLRGPSGTLHALVSRRVGAQTAVSAPVPLEPGLYEID